MNKKLFKYSILFLTGMCLYTTIEVMYRSFSYKLMALVGGFCMAFILDKVNEVLPWDTPLLFQMVISGLLITVVELISGEFALRILHVRMWDYRNLFMNCFDGLVCPLFTFVWILLSGFGIVLCDAINYYVLHEDQRPYYRGARGNVLFELPVRSCENK